MATKISKTMGEQLVKALGNPSYEMVGARTNTERAMHARGLVFHGRLREPVLDGRGHQVRTHGMMLTDEGVKEARRLQAEQAEERGEEAGAEEVTREDVARGVEDALQWLRWEERETAAAKGAVSVLEREFWRSGKVWRKLAKQGNRVPVELQALNYYQRVTKLLAAARRFELEDAADNASEVSARFAAVQSGAAVEEKGMEDMSEQEHASAFGERFAQAQRARAEEAAQGGQEAEPREFRGLTRADVAEDAARALEALAEEDRATVEGKAPSVVLGLAFRRAQKAWCARVGERTAEEEAAYTRCANVASAALLFEQADDPAAAVEARAQGARLEAEERAAESRRLEEARAAALVAEWRGAERHGKYLVRTEEAGHGIVRVFVRGPGSEVASIERSAGAYARAHGLRPGASAGGGEFFDGEYIAQQAYHRA